MLEDKKKRNTLCHELYNKPFSRLNITELKLLLITINSENDSLIENSLKKKSKKLNVKKKKKNYNN